MPIFNELPKRFSKPTSKIRYGIIKAIGDSLDEVSDKIASVQDQYLFSKASGVYLLRLAQRYGLEFQDTNIYTPDLLRSVAPLVSYQPQCVTPTLWKIVKAFYNKNYLHANVSGEEGNYSLEDKTLTVEVDGKREQITFTADRFDDPANATIDEVIQFYNFEAKFSKVYFRRTADNTKFIVLRSGKQGYSNLKVIGGDANLEFKFGTTVEPTNPDITITKGLSPHTEIEWISLDPSLFYQVQKGDFLTIKTDALNDVFEVVSIDENKLTIFTDLSAGTYTETPSVFFFQKNIEYNLYDNLLYAAIDEASLYDEVFFTLPAVAPIQVNYLENAWHVWEEKYDITTFTRDTLTVDGIGTLGDISFSIHNDNIDFLKKGVFYGNNPSAGLVNLTTKMPYTAFTDVNKAVSPIRVDGNELIVTTDHEHQLSSCVEVEFQGTFSGTYSVKRVENKNRFILEKESDFETLQIYRIEIELIYGLIKLTPYSVSDLSKFKKGNKVWVRDVSPLQHIEMTVLKTDNSFVWLEAPFPAINKVISEDIEIEKTLNIDDSDVQYKVDPSQEFYQDLRMTIIQGESVYPSYIYENEVPTPRGISGTLVQALFAGTHVQIKITTNDTFPPSGFAVINNTKTESEIVKYTSVTKINDVTFYLNVEDSYILERDHASGSEIRLLNIDSVDFVNAPFLQSTADKREECVRILKQAVAGGVEVTPEIVYPEINNEDESIKIFEV